jgi:DNA-binding beta-propeller fold protein YncE
VATVARSAPATLEPTGIALPGATAPVTLDYVAFEPARSRVWIPVGDTASVDVFDVHSRTFVRIDGFKSVEREAHGRKRMLGPSAAAVGEGYVYVGDRASSEVCPIDATTLKAVACVTLPAPTDGVAYVASTHEVWVTTPRDRALVILDASRPTALKIKTTVRLDGAPEGYAVDESKGIFFTNLEDKNQTVSIDVKTHEPLDRWNAGCGPDGPRGIAVDAAHGFVFVACTDHVVVLDAAHGGTPLARLDSGAGVDNIDWVPSRRLLYVASPRSARLVVARVDDSGQPMVVAAGASREGARNAVAGPDGSAFLPDPNGAQLLVFPAPGP